MTKQSPALSALTLVGSLTTSLKTQCSSALEPGNFFLLVADIYRRISFAASNSWRIYEDFTQWFTDTNITLLTEAVHFANRVKVTFAAARGNEGYVNQSYPAIIDDDWVLCVGGTGKDGEYKSISNGDNWWAASKGWEIDVAAPATSEIIRTTTSGGGYQSFNGTSAATPHVAGVAGLLMSYLNSPNPSYDNLAPEDVEEIIQRTAKDNNLSIDSVLFLGPDSLCGLSMHTSCNLLIIRRIS